MQLFRCFFLDLFFVFCSSLHTWLIALLERKTADVIKLKLLKSFENKSPKLKIKSLTHVEKHNSFWTKFGKFKTNRLRLLAHTQSKIVALVASYRSRLNCAKNTLAAIFTLNGGAHIRAELGCFFLLSSFEWDSTRWTRIEKKPNKTKQNKYM